MSCCLLQNKLVRDGLDGSHWWWKCWLAMGPFLTLFNLIFHLMSFSVTGKFLWRKRRSLLNQLQLFSSRLVPEMLSMSRNFFRKSVSFMPLCSVCKCCLVFTSFQEKEGNWKAGAASQSAVFRSCWSFYLVLVCYGCTCWTRRSRPVIFLWSVNVSYFVVVLVVDIFTRMHCQIHYSRNNTAL